MDEVLYKMFNFLIVDVVAIAIVILLIVVGYGIYKRWTERRKV